MSLERRLRQHFDTAGSTLSEPDADLDNVVKRGRRRVAIRNGAVAAGTLAVATVAVLGFQGLSETNVEFAPATPAPPTTSPTPSDVAIDTATAEPSEATGPVVEMVSLEDLGAPVIAYGGSTRDLNVYDEQGGRQVWSGRVDAAFSDGDGGVVVQVGKTLTWFPSAEPDQSTTLVESDVPIELRGVLPGGRVVYSTVDRTGPEERRERFYSVPVKDNAKTDLMASEFSYDTWYEGPAVVSAATSGEPPAGASVTPGQIRYVLASCHMVCTIHEWFPGGKESYGEELYKGGAMEGLTASPDGRVVGLLEGQTAAGIRPPEVVLFDGHSFEVLTKLALPTGKTALISSAFVSLSPDGQRVLASVDVSEDGSGQFRSFLVEGALTRSPRVREVDFDGVVGWLDN